MKTATTHIIAIRHGETDWNLEGRIQGHTDIGLNALGRQQAALVAQALAAEPLSAIYSSDLQRAFDTASAIAAAQPRAPELPVVLELRLRERCFGTFEGELYAALPQIDPTGHARLQSREPRYAPAGGESAQGVYDRVLAATAQLAARHGGQTIALVAHGGVLDCLYRAAGQIALDAQRDWELGNASINRLAWSDGVLSVVEWSDARHLEGINGKLNMPL